MFSIYLNYIYKCIYIYLCILYTYTNINYMDVTQPTVIIVVMLYSLTSDPTPLQ